jgi:glutamine amidotransferase
MAQLQRHGLTEVILEAARSKPFLGICMGLQVLLDASEENDGTGCLGLYPGESRYFGEPLNDPDSGERLKIPHMGWNRVWQQRPHPLWAGIADGARFYFVHSYYVAPRDRALPVASTNYGLRFTSAIADKNLFACQFHPEKSARDGLQLLENFTRWEGVPP